MKTLLLLSLALLTGCCCPHFQPIECCQPRTGYMIVNNTDYFIDLIQDGQLIAKKMKPGAVQPIPSLVLSQKSVVVAVGYDEAGIYQGTDKWTFINSTPEAWPVTTLYRTGSTPPHFR